MNNDAASTVFGRFMHWTLMIALIGGVGMGFLLQILRSVMGGGNNAAPMAGAIFFFFLTLMLGAIFSASASILSGLWFEQRETPYEFAIAPQRLKAATWALFCLAFPLVVMIGAGILNPNGAIFTYGQLALVFGVVASFVANSVINSMADDVRSNPHAKEKRLHKLTDDDKSEQDELSLNALEENEVQGEMVI